MFDKTDAILKPGIEEDACTNANSVRKIQCSQLGQPPAVFSEVSFLGTKATQSQAATSIAIRTEGSRRKEKAMKGNAVSRRFEPAIYQDIPDAIATVNVFDHGSDRRIPVNVGEYYHDRNGSKLILRKDLRSTQMLCEAREILLQSTKKPRPVRKSKRSIKKADSPRYEAAIAKDEPDALATVSIFDPDLDTNICIEVGYYYHDRSAGTIVLLYDAGIKDILANASEINLKRLVKSRPTDSQPNRTFVPANSYRLTPGR